MKLAEFHELLSTENALMLYFYNETCGVCTSLWPRVEHLLSSGFPQIRLIRVDAAQSRELAGQLQMFTIPGILLFFQGKEYYRSSGMISMVELEEKVKRGIMNFEL